MSNKKSSNARNEDDDNESCDHGVIGTQDIPIIDLSDDDEVCSSYYELNEILHFIV